MKLSFAICSVFLVLIAFAVEVAAQGTNVSTNAYMFVGIVRDSANAGEFFADLAGFQGGVGANLTIPSGRTYNMSYDNDPGEESFNLDAEADNYLQLAANFTDGVYTITAYFVNGVIKNYTQRLSGAFPAFPSIIYPTNGTTNVNPEDFTVRWQPVIDPNVTDVALFIREIESEENVVEEFLQPNVTFFSVEPWLLRTGAEHKMELTPAIFSEGGGIFNGYFNGSVKASANISLFRTISSIIDKESNVLVGFVRNRTGSGEFFAEVTGLQGSVGANLTTPSGKVYNMSYDDHNNLLDEYELGVEADDYRTLESNFTDGNYIVTVYFVDGEIKNYTQRLSGPFPAFMSLTRPQNMPSIDPYNFTITWNPITDPLTNSILFFIDDLEFDVDEVFSAFIPPSQNSYAVPPGILRLGFVPHLLEYGTAIFSQGATFSNGIFNGSVKASIDETTFVTTPSSRLEPQYRIEIKSDQNTASARMSGPGIPPYSTIRQLDIGRVSNLSFVPVDVGNFGSWIQIPPGAPFGTRIISIHPAAFFAGQTGYFRSSFNLPSEFTNIHLVGRAVVDDIGRIFLNGQLITPSMFSGSEYTVGESDSQAFYTNNESIFRSGENEILIADVNSDGLTSAGSFYAIVRYNPPGLTITTQQIPPTVLGNFSSTQLTATRGTPPYSWSITSGSLPSGMSLSPAGIYSGIPTIAGMFNFTVRVTDSNNTRAERTLMHEVTLTLPPPEVRVYKAGTTAVPGRTLEYFIAVENAGNFPAQNVVVDEYLDTSLFNLTSTNPPATVEGNESYPVNIVSWNIPTLAPLETRVFAYRAKLNASTPMGTEVVGGPVVVNALAPLSNQTGQGSWRPLPLPAEGYKIIKNGGFECVIPNIRPAHAAVDIQASIGTQVTAIAPGEVFYVGEFGDIRSWARLCRGTLYGQTVIIKHDNNEYSFYAHLNASLVQRNQRVAAGQLIGYSGISGSGGCAAWWTPGYGPHLHFGYFRGGIRDGDGVNPCSSLDRIANPEKCTCSNGDSDEHKQNATRPIDPNEKEVIANRFIQSDQLLVYPIHFENIGNVSALDVFVDDVLDRNINYSAVQVLSPNGTFNPQTGLLRWEIYGINLEPNATGVVMFSAKPKQGLPSGTRIRNNATIQFEIFERITTNTVENVIDDIKPNCTMNPLPDITQSLNFTVSWNGTDTIGEIDDYSIFASINDGAFNQFVSTRQTSATFIGERGRTYKFICIAQDTAGNVEVQSPIAEAQTRIPGASLQLLGIPQIGTTVNLSVSDWAHPGNKYVLAMSLGTTPGIPLGDGRIIPLNPDIIFLLSIQGPPLIGLRNSINFLNEQGQGTTYWDIPNVPELNGITVYAAFVVLDHTLPIPFASISNAVPITIRT